LHLPHIFPRSPYISPASPPISQLYDFTSFIDDLPTSPPASPPISQVYDFTSFLEEHPAGPESILKLGGTDGTEMYETVHNAGMLDDFEAELVGTFQP